jgi:hypothetical protein
LIRATRLETAAAFALLALLAVGLSRAAALAWVCDDSFISIRYAENLMAGHGLVYNPGERVEGYTNLLWTLLLAALMKLGAPPIRAAEVPGIVAYLWLALCLAHWSRRQSRDGERPFLPLAAGLVLVSDDFHVWATGGLETMLFTALAVQALLLTRLESPSWRRPLWAGALFALLVLTRPDGLLFAAAGAVSYWIPAGRLSREARWRHSLVTVLPVVAVLAVLVPWKLAYYGDLLPTAFYSKSVLRPYYSQGILYVGVYLLKNWFLLVAGALAAVAYLLRRDEIPAKSRWDDRFFLGTCVLFTAYLVHVGGDFMLARRLVPVLPLLFLVIENRVARWPTPRSRTALAGLALVAAALPIPVFTHWARINGISDERRFYPAELVEARRRQAEAVGGALRGTPARVAFEGGMCVFGYYSGLPYLVEITGLTQYSLAKRPLAERGFIGHEKVADSEWLTENEIHFVVSQREPPVSRPAGVLRVDEIYFDDLALARIHLYSDAVMDPLRQRPDVDFVPIERVIELSRRRMEQAPLGEAEQIYQELQRFYFDGAGARGEAKQSELLELLERKRRQEASGAAPRASFETGPSPW